MAMKLVDQDEAAKFLGVSIEEINALRDRKELFPFRDGNAWKYKLDDLERLKNDRAAGGSSWGKADDLADIPLEVNEHVESILLSEKELGQSGESTSSTIIGKPGRKASPDESDLQIAPHRGRPASEAGASDVSLAAGLSGTGSDVKLVLGGSDAAKKDTGGTERSRSAARTDRQQQNVVGVGRFRTQTGRSLGSRRKAAARRRRSSPAPTPKN